MELQFLGWEFTLLRLGLTIALVLIPWACLRRPSITAEKMQVYRFSMKMRWRRSKRRSVSRRPEPLGRGREK